MSSGSCLQRDLTQMANRVRKVKDNTIHVYLNKIPYKEHANFYSYDEVKTYMTDVQKTYINTEIVKDDKTGKYVMRKKYSLLDEILIYNEQEKLHKGPYYFVPYLLKLLKDKGHTFEYVKKTKKDTREKGNIYKEELLEANDINKVEYKALLKKQKNNTASRKDKVEIEKYVYKDKWNVKEINEEFLDKYYGKTHVLNNLRMFLGKTEIKPYVTTNKKDEYVLDFNKVKQKEKIKMIKQVIKKLGFEEINDNKLISKDDFEKNIQHIVNNCDMFTDINKSKPLFGINIKRNFISVKSFMGFINSVFKNWGFKIGRWGRRVKIKKKTKELSYYKLIYINNIDLYL